MMRAILERVADRVRGESLAVRFPPPAVPWTEEYAQRHRDFVSMALTDEALLERFRRRRRLPRGYGIGLDERVVELAWLLAQDPGGRVLDAGSSLNHEHVLDCFLSRFESLTIATLEPEEISFSERRVAYVYADLRELPFRDQWFDTVVCISTLEHVGMDNSRYGSSLPRSGEPQRELLDALDELTRVLRPGGRFLATVPFGVREDHGWFRQFDESDVATVTEALGRDSSSVTVYSYTSDGWQLSDLGTSSRAKYRDYMADQRPVPDLAAAARAVACVRAVC